MIIIKRKHNFRFIRQEVYENIIDAKEELEKINYKNIFFNKKKKILDFIDYVSDNYQKINISDLFLYNEIIFAIYNNAFHKSLSHENFDIVHPNNQKLKVPFFAKAGIGSPLFYIDIGKRNLSVYKELIKLLNKYEIPNIDEFEAVNFKNVKRINIPQQTFLIGYLIGLGFVYENIALEELQDFIKKKYEDIYKKHS